MERKERESRVGGREGTQEGVERSWGGGRKLNGKNVKGEQT